MMMSSVVGWGMKRGEKFLEDHLSPTHTPPTIQINWEESFALPGLVMLRMGDDGHPLPQWRKGATDELS